MKGNPNLGNHFILSPAGYMRGKKRHVFPGGIFLQKQQNRKTVQAQLVIKQFVKDKKKMCEDPLTLG